MGRKKGYGSLLLFFAVMLALTFISRVYDTWTVAKVRTAYSKAKAVEIRVAGTGRILAGNMVFCPVSEGYRIEEVLAGQGEIVDEGAVLFRYQMSSLEQEQKRLRKEIQKLQLGMEKERVSAQIFSDVTQLDLANREEAIRVRELKRGREEYEEAQKEHQQILQDLEAEYELKASIMKEELLWQKEREYEAGLSSLSGSRNSRDAALRTARRMAEDLEQELLDLEQEGAEEGKLESVRKKLKRAQEDLEEQENLWEEQIDAERLDLDYIDDGQGRVIEGMTSGQLEMRLLYEAQVKQEKEALRNKEKEVELLFEAVLDAEEKKRGAALEDEKTRLTNEQRASLAELNRRELKLDLEELERELYAVERMIAEDGKVVSPSQGTVLELGLTPGQKTSGTELVQIGTGGLVFEGIYETEEEEGRRLFPGDSLAVGGTGESNRLETVIKTVNLLGEQKEEKAKTVTFLAEVPKEAFLIGEHTPYECVKRSGQFETVIPLEGLRRDQDGYYCLVVRIRKSVLGEEQVAERVDLTVLEKGDREAAVEGPLYQEDPVVVDSSIMVDQGSRVRITEAWN